MNNIKYSLLVLLALLAACGQNTAQQPSDIVGLLEVQISLDGTAKASFIPQGVSAQSNTVVSDIGINFVRQLVTFNDDNDTTVNATRYVSAVFGITNTTANAFSNLTLYAINVPTNIGGTTIAAMRTGDDVLITSASIAQGMKPTHGMRNTLKGLEVDPDRADLHVIDQAEANTIQTGAVGLTPPIVGDVLQYGFAIRNLSGGRSIGASGCVGTNCNKGVVTLAYKLPKVEPRKNNPFTFNLYFVVANESSTIVTQSLEEQSSNAGLNARVASLGAGTLVRILPGSSYTGTSTRICQVRTAGTNATPLATLVPQNLIEVDGVCDPNNAAALSAINTARATGRTCGSTFFPAAPPVAWNPKLSRAAIDYSRDMATFNTFFPEIDLDTRINNAGYSGGWSGLFLNGPATSLNAFNSLLGGPSGCANIMTASNTNFALNGASATPGGTMWWTFIIGNGN